MWPPCELLYTCYLLTYQRRCVTHVLLVVRGASALVADVTLRRRCPGNGCRGNGTVRRRAAPWRLVAAAAALRHHQSVVVAVVNVNKQLVGPVLLVVARLLLMLLMLLRMMRMRMMLVARSCMSQAATRIH